MALRQELENAAKREAQREKTITRLLNENEDFRRWYGADLPDAVRRLHQRPPAQTPVIVHNACPKVSLCPMRAVTLNERRFKCRYPAVENALARCASRKND